MYTAKTRENRARNQLARYGYVLKKSPSRSWESKYYGPGYMIISRHSNVVKWGCYNRQWDLTLTEVEEIIADHSLLKAAA